jgi:hypothetical protein
VNPCRIHEGFFVTRYCLRHPKTHTAHLAIHSPTTPNIFKNRNTAFQTKDFIVPPGRNDTFCTGKKGVINRIMTSPHTPRQLEMNFLICRNFLNFVYSYSCIVGQNLKQNLSWWRIWTTVEE